MSTIPTFDSFNDAPQQPLDEIGRLLFIRCLKIYKRYPTPTAVRHLHGLLNQFFYQLTRESRVQFTTFFSRIAFVGQAYHFPKPLIRDLQWFRRAFRQHLIQGKDHPAPFLAETLRIT
ncbi:MAG: hypothetical protein AAF598_14875, partial [Bacteroidota bacterium]